MSRRGRVTGLLLLAAVARPASAHELRPAYLEVRETARDTYDVLWKVPAQADRRLALRARFPTNCIDVAPPRSELVSGAAVERWTTRCEGGLAGRGLRIDGLSFTLTDALVRVQRADGATQVARLTASVPSFVVEGSPGRLQVAAAYLRLGVEHILLGIDHLLFVLALLILVRERGRLVATVTAFTAAHSLTLGAATLGFVRVSQPPIEAAIALSIVFVATEIVHGRQGNAGLTERAPWTVAFVFGLLHGFGFAGALREVGLPQQAIPVALLFFNVGVELGQLLFIASVLAVIGLARLVRMPWPSWGWRLPAYGVGAVAAFWIIERVARFGS